MRATSVKPIRSLARGLDVLLAVEAHGATTLHELHVRTQLPKATLMRILLTLEARDLVWQRVADAKYLPGYALKAAARHIDESDRVVQVASPALLALSRRTGLASHLALPGAAWMEMRELRRPNAPPKDSRVVGRHVNMLLSGLGRAYLAYCPADELERVLERLRRSPRPGDALARNRAWVKRVLDETRSRGYAVRDPSFGSHFDLPKRQFNDGMAAFAVPIRVADRVVACMNLMWREHLATPASMAARYLTEVNACVARIGAALNNDVMR